MRCGVKSLCAASLALALTVVACTSQLDRSAAESGDTKADVNTEAGTPGPIHVQAVAAKFVAPLDVAKQLSVPPLPAGSVHIGRLVSVYGCEHGCDEPALYAHSVFVAPRWRARLGEDVTLLSCNPDSLHQRVWIQAPVASPEFERVVRRMMAPVAELQASMPCNATIRVTFANDAAAARAAAAGNIELLAFGKPVVPNMQVFACGRSVLIHPCVTGTDALALGGSGQRSLPQTAMQLQVGNDEGAIRREFEARGSLPDAQPPRILGSMNVYLQQVGKVRSGSRILTLFMGGIEHGLDAGDVLRIHHPKTGLPLVALEVLRDAVAPGGKPDRVHVRVPATFGEQGFDWLEALDPSNLPDFPLDSPAARNAFVKQHGPMVTIRTVYEPSEGDHSSNFVTVSAQTVGDTDGNRKNVAPDATFDIEFSQPVDCLGWQSVRLVLVGSNV